MTGASQEGTQRSMFDECVERSAMAWAPEERSAENEAKAAFVVGIAFKVLRSRGVPIDELTDGKRMVERIYIGHGDRVWRIVSDTNDEEASE